MAQLTINGLSKYMGVPLSWHVALAGLRPVVLPVVQAALTALLLAVGLPQECAQAAGQLLKLFGL